MLQHRSFTLTFQSIQHFNYFVLVNEQAMIFVLLLTKNLRQIQILERNLGPKCPALCIPPTFSPVHHGNKMLTSLYVTLNVLQNTITCRRMQPSLLFSVGYPTFSSWLYYSQLFKNHLLGNQLCISSGNSIGL